MNYYYKDNKRPDKDELWQSKDKNKHRDHDQHKDWHDWDDHKDRKKSREKDKHKDWDHEYHHESDDWDDHKDHKKCRDKDKHKDWDHNHHNESDDWFDLKDHKKSRKKEKHKDWDHDFHDCGCEKDNLNEKHPHNCVCKKVRDINEAQHKVKQRKDGCDVSCERSIKELLEQCKHPNHDTIPFKLLCGCSKGDCETFIGTGVVKIDGCFYDIKSAFFRVVDFVKGSNCCAILELLCPERCDGKQHGIEGFIRTGACFEVDLKDFVGITCFPPVKAKKMDPKKFLCS